MDRKGWIILILCALGLVFTYNSWNEDNIRLLEQQRIQQELAQKAKEKEGEKPSPEAGQVVEGEPPEDKPDVPEGFVEEGKPTIKPEEVFYELNSLDDEGNPVVKYTFTNRGGGVKEALLVNEPEGLDGKVVINKYADYPIGALGDADGDVRAYYYPDEAVEVKETSITFTLTSKSGLTIVKSWQLCPENDKSSEHRLKLNVSFLNKGESTVNLKDYSVTSGIVAPLFEKEAPHLSKWFFYEADGYDSGSSGPFKDGWFWGKAKDVDIHTVQNLEYAGVSNQFYTIIVTPTTAGKRLWVDDGMVMLDSGSRDLRVYRVGMGLPDNDLLQGASASFKYDIYMGPRRQSKVTELGENTQKTMSYGWFGFGAPWANSGINWLHDAIAVKIHKGYAWGIALILLTIIIRILIWPLANKSTRTMKRMSKLAPLMKEIREKYSDEPQKVQQETLKLYRKYKINPMGGCLPILVQMPIFFAVFGMLTNASELRGQEFLWVSDLSQQENLFTIPLIGLPFNLLPITMAVTMIFQMKMTPSTADKLQQRIFMFLPIVFFFFCYSFASALALYWTVQNIISIGQTWLMQRLPEPELEEIKGDSTTSSKPRKKGFMERMAEKVEEAQKQREEQMARKTGKPTPKAKKNPAIPGEKATKGPKRKNPKTGG